MAGSLLTLLDGLPVPARAIYIGLILTTLLLSWGCVRLGRRAWAKRRRRARSREERQGQEWLDTLDELDLEIGLGDFTETLRKACESPEPTLLVGPAGCGKTRLIEKLYPVGAPALGPGDCRPVHVDWSRPGHRDPFVVLERAIRTVEASAPPPETGSAGARGGPRAMGGTPWQYAHRALMEMTRTRRPLLIFDHCNSRSFEPDDRRFWRRVSVLTTLDVRIVCIGRNPDDKVLRGIKKQLDEDGEHRSRLIQFQPPGREGLERALRCLEPTVPPIAVLRPYLIEDMERSGDEISVGRFRLIVRGLVGAPRLTHRQYKKEGGLNGLEAGAIAALIRQVTRPGDEGLRGRVLDHLERIAGPSGYRVDPRHDDRGEVGEALQLLVREGVLRIDPGPAGAWVAYPRLGELLPMVRERLRSPASARRIGRRWALVAALLAALAALSDDPGSGDAGSALRVTDAHALDEARASRRLLANELRARGGLDSSSCEAGWVRPYSRASEGLSPARNILVTTQALAGLAYAEPGDVGAAEAAIRVLFEPDALRCPPGLQSRHRPRDVGGQSGGGFHVSHIEPVAWLGIALARLSSLPEHGAATEPGIEAHLAHVCRSGLESFGPTPGDSPATPQMCGPTPDGAPADRRCAEPTPGRPVWAFAWRRTPRGTPGVHATAMAALWLSEIEASPIARSVPECEGLLRLIEPGLESASALLEAAPQAPELAGADHGGLDFELAAASARARYALGSQPTPSEIRIVDAVLEAATRPPHLSTLTFLVKDSTLPGRDGDPWLIERRVWALLTAHWWALGGWEGSERALKVRNELLVEVARGLDRILRGDSWQIAEYAFALGQIIDSAPPHGLAANPGSRLGEPLVTDPSGD